PKSVIALTLAAVTWPVHAQVGEKGRISTRSDVRMSIEGLPGTSGKKIEALAQALSKPLGDVKRCYAELVKEHPEAVGELTVALRLPEGKPGAQVDAPGAAGKLRPLKRCIDRAFGRMDVGGIPRPAGAQVLLELTNSA